MTQASYNDIAEWYDQFLRERPVYTEVILPNLLALVGEVEGEVICDRPAGRAGWRVSWHDAGRRPPVWTWHRTCWHSHDILRAGTVGGCVSSRRRSTR
jgi:hypothetical protein